MQQAPPERSSPSAALAAVAGAVPFAAISLVALLASCAPATVEAGPDTPAAPPPPPAAPAPPGDAADAAREGYTEADVLFMQGMIVHHAQALEMVELAPARAENERVLLLSRRIELSQVDEMALMRRWLEARGEDVPDARAEHAGHHQSGGEAAFHGVMHGMASPEEMRRLANARGAAFDRLLLELMIRHHEGALIMVEELFASESGGMGAEIYQIASHIDADQRGEIARMRSLLAEIS